MSNEFQTQPQPKVTVSAITAEDLKEAMMGSQTDPTYAEQFGVTSAPLGTTGYQPPSLAALELEAAKAIAKAQADAVAAQEANRPPDPFATPNDELEKFKQLYGQSENEKGALRKNQAELMEAFNGLMAQFEALQANTQQGQWAQPASVTNAPQYGQPPAYQQPYQDPFSGLGDEDVVQGKQIKDLVARHIAPALQEVLAQNQQAQAKVAQLENRLVKQVRESSGISPVDEFRLTARNPWLRDLPPAARVQALASLRQAEVAQQPPPQQVAPQPQAPTDAQQRILNRVTYVEGAPANVPDSTEAALEAAKQRDYAKAMMSPMETGERAKMLRAWALKYGDPRIGQPPSDIAH